MKQCVGVGQYLRSVSNREPRQTPLNLQISAKACANERLDHAKQHMEKIRT